MFGHFLNAEFPQVGASSMPFKPTLFTNHAVHSVFGHSYCVKWENHQGVGPKPDRPPGQQGVAVRKHGLENQ